MKGRRPGLPWATSLSRVASLAAALFCLAVPGRAITIPVTTARSTGFSSSGTLLTTDAAPDGNWTFYAGNDLSALSGSPVGAWVVRTIFVPFWFPGWSPNTTASQWISPTNNRGIFGLAPVAGTSYIAVTSFQIPAMTNPPNWPQWLLVMSGQVWADDSVKDNQFYLLTSTNSIQKTISITGTPSGITSGSFAFTAWVEPGATYKLAFILPNTQNPWSGFRLQFNEAYVTPEPGACALMLSVGAGLAYASSRRRSKKPQS